MLIGAMNHPKHDVLKEIEWMAEWGVDFIDLTLEPPAAAAWRIDVKKVRSLLERYRLKAVGHTAYYLPFASPFESLRQGALLELKRCIEIFSELNVTWVNLHPDRNIPMHDKEFAIERNIQSIGELLPIAEKYGVGLMIENLPGHFNSVEQLDPLLKPFPQLGVHLDIGHANLLVEENTTEEIIECYGERVRHVHLHDNKGGGADLHLPLGAGNMDIEFYVQLLKASGYDDTITLEVFSEDHHYFKYSRDLLRKLWDQGVAVPQKTNQSAAPVRTFETPNSKLQIPSSKSS
jgi:sugar phosphate isomerase/epimerase